MSGLTLLDAITAALAYELEHDPDVLLFGVDIGLNGGVFRATQGLQARFGERRVFDTPLAEGLIAGMAVGLAAQGLREVTHVRVTGPNGYQQQFDLAPFAQVPLTLVRYQDDKPLTRRNKGPVWLLMPFSEYPEFDVSPIHSFMVWQLVRIEVIP